jgi:archaellum biogenesis ATPase FlaH
MSIITRIWKEQPGKYFFLSTKDRAGEWKDHPFRKSQFAEVDKFIEANADKDLYWCCHGFTKNRRLKRYAEIPRLLWADMDESDPRDAPEFLPSIAIESSPGRFYGVWRLLDFMTEDINRRLTYHLKADPGGWDLTQVIRIPGTFNHKYESKPKVKLLWMDGPEYKLKDIESKLPRERKAKDHDVALGLYKKYESKFSGWVRRQLLRGKPQPGKRSEVLWKLTNELMEAGCSSNEAFELLRVSPWNKFVKRRDGDEQLKREIDKATKQHFRVIDDTGKREDANREEHEGLEDDEEPEYKFLSRSMAEVEEEKLDWIWYPYLARGEVSILEGDPGLGKSYLAQMAAMAICDGKRLTSVKPRKVDIGKVAYFDIENAAGSVTKRRLMDNGAENLHNFYQEQEPFTIDDDDTLDRVYDAIETLRPTLVVFDTLNTYLGSVDTHNSAETQQTFKRFIDIARRFNTAVLVLRHLTKSNKGVTALYRGQGSIAFAGLARVVMTVGRHPEDPDMRVMAVTKINVARVPKALQFSIEEIPSSLKDDDRSKFVWGDFVDLTADEILNAAPAALDAETEAVVEWLRDSLAEGGLKKAKLISMGEARSFTEKMIDKAGHELRVKKDGDMWWLPDDMAEEEATA